jgi:hypothetical protein
LARRVTTEDELVHVDHPDDAGFAPAEKAVLRFTNAYYADDRAVPDAVWDELRRHYSEPEIIEIAWTISTFIMFGKLIRAFRIPYGSDADRPSLSDGRSAAPAGAGDSVPAGAHGPAPSGKEARHG